MKNVHKYKIRMSGEVSFSSYSLSVQSTWTSSRELGAQLYDPVMLYKMEGRCALGALTTLVLTCIQVLGGIWKETGGRKTCKDI